MIKSMILVALMATPLKQGDIINQQFTYEKFAKYCKIFEGREITSKQGKFVSCLLKVKSPKSEYKAISVLFERLNDTTVESRSLLAVRKDTWEEVPIGDVQFKKELVRG